MNRKLGVATTIGVLMAMLFGIVSAASTHTTVSTPSHTGLNSQSGANVQSGLNVQSGSDIQSGPNLQQVGGPDTEAGAAAGAEIDN